MREWEYEWEGMWDRNKVFPLIYEKSYKEWIIDRITENPKFGPLLGDRDEIIKFICFNYPFLFCYWL